MFHERKIYKYAVKPPPVMKSEGQNVSGHGCAAVRCSARPGTRIDVLEVTVSSGDGERLRRAPSLYFGGTGYNR